MSDPMHPAWFAVELIAIAIAATCAAGAVLAASKRMLGRTALAMVFALTAVRLIVAMHP